MARIGHVIDGKFRILKPVGKGGMSRVYLAQDIHLGKRWVVKEIPKFVNGGKNTLFIHAALSEAEIIKSLDHPGVVRIVDIAQDARAVYIVEDYVEGRSLKTIADEEDAIEPSDLRDWAIQLCRILIYLHSREPAVIYRDLKPENIILTESGHIKLVDFGIARRYRPDGDRDTVYLGTVQFAAPEQYEEYGAQTDMRTDIYGYGKTMEYLAYYCPDLSEDVYELIEKCIREDPDDRYQSAELLLQALLGIRNFSRAITKKRLVMRIMLFAAAMVLLLLAAMRPSPESKGNLMSEIRAELEEIREDQVFSLQEEEQLLNKIMPHLSELKEMEGFTETAFEIGKLYLDCYAYGSGRYTGAEGAGRWFDLAGEQDEIAEIYGMMVRYQIDSEGLDPVSAEEGEYLGNMGQLIQIAARTADCEQAGELREEVCSIAADALTINIYQYKKDGVSLRDIDLLLTYLNRMVRKIREEAEAVPEKLITAEQLESKLALAGQAVASVYPA